VSVAVSGSQPGAYPFCKKEGLSHESWTFPGRITSFRRPVAPDFPLAFEENPAMNTDVFYIACAIFIFLWSEFRFYDISAPYRERLKFYWLVALAYSGYYLVLFVVAIIFLSLISTEIVNLLVDHVPDSLKKILEGSPEVTPPLLSAALLYKAHDIRFFHWLDKFIVDRLLSAQDLEEDFTHLKMLLENNEFSPSKAEFTANFKMMEDFDVFVSNPLEEPPDLHSGDPITLWRKVSTLIRFCEACVAEDNDTRREAEIAELRQEHKRRTGVALHLLRLKLSAETYQEIGQQIDTDKPVALILTSEELNRTTKLVSQYIIADYKKLMSAVSSIAAHLVIYSGSSAGKRLEQLTDAGFKGLGCFRELTIHKIILLLTTVFIGAFVVIYSSFLWIGVGGGNPFALAIRIAAMYAGSALCGSLIGSRRRLMVQSETPWGWYLLAGALGWLTWLIVTVLVEVSPGGGDSLAKQLKDFFLTPEKFSDRVAWSILPSVLAMGIAALSHLNPLTQRVEGMNVRLGDGIMLGLVLVVGAWVTLLVHHGMDTNFGTRISLNNVLSLSLTCFVVAFIVGFTVIVIARSVAHSGLATNPDDGF
jgi:hypothetical protein